jgi:hypothetical protein
MKYAFFFSCFCITTFIFSSRILHAQDTRVENVRFQEIGETVVIQYDLRGKSDKKYNVSVLLSDDGGRTFRIKPRSVDGDVGKNIPAGTGKKINWYYKKDFPNGLSGGEFVFAVDAELQKGKKTWVYVLGAGAVGGAVYYFTGKKKESDKGSIVVDIPGEY